MQRTLELLLESETQERTMAGIGRHPATFFDQEQQWRKEVVRDSLFLRWPHRKRSEEQIYSPHRKTEKNQQIQAGTRTYR